MTFDPTPLIVVLVSVLRRLHLQFIVNVLVCGRYKGQLSTHYLCSDVYVS